MIICSCSKELYNKIASSEGNRGRAQFKINPFKFGFVELLGYTQNSDGRLDWWIVGKCPTCSREQNMKLRAFNNAHTCRQCAQEVRNIKWRYAMDNPITYGRWKRMMSRCYNINSPKYFSHGERGIEVCNEWHNFDNFYFWCLENNEFKGCHMHRLNNDEGYKPSNCTLITNSEHSSLHTKETQCLWT